MLEHLHIQGRWLTCQKFTWISFFFLFTWEYQNHTVLSSLLGLDRDNNNNLQINCNVYTRITITRLPSRKKYDLIHIKNSHKTHKKKVQTTWTTHVEQIPSNHTHYHVTRILLIKWEIHTLSKIYATSPKIYTISACFNCPIIRTKLASTPFGSKFYEKYIDCHKKRNKLDIESTHKCWSIENIYNLLPFITLH